MDLYSAFLMTEMIKINALFNLKKKTHEKKNIALYCQ